MAESEHSRRIRRRQVDRAVVELKSGAARAAAANIFSHCFPLMLMDAVRRAHGAGVNQLQLVLPGQGAMLAPGLAEDDVRVVLASVWMDLADQPVVLSLPHCHGQHLSVTLFDTGGEAFASLGTRTGNDAGLALALVGPQWRGELPSGITARRAPCDSVWAVCRIHAHSAFGRPEAVAAAKQLTVTPLSLRTQLRPAMAIFEPGGASCLSQVEQMAPAEFFHRLGPVLDAAPRNLGIRLQVTALRNQLGGPPSPTQWTPELAHALSRGFADGLDAIRSAAAASCGERLGWRTTDAGGADDDVGGAGRQAYSSLGAPLREDLMSFVCDHDEFGLPLAGQHRYRLHFEKDALPPAHAFWWLSVRPPASFARRPGLGSRSDLALNPDGSLDLIVQHEAPAVAEIPNWIRSPEGRFALTMRLYCPRPAALEGGWRLPPLTRLDVARPDRLSASFAPTSPATFGRRTQLGR
jgi:hypothetical protein